jgi:hypothetical protein
MTSSSSASPSPLLYYNTTDNRKSFEGLDQIIDYFGEVLRVHLTDGRLFYGTLCMTDNRGHLVLQGDIVWPSPDQSPSRENRINKGKMGMVAIAPQHIRKIERKQQTTTFHDSSSQSLKIHQ